MPVTKTPIQKRPAFWVFLTAGAAFGSVYFLEGRVDSTLLLEFITAVMALVGLAKLGYDKYQERKDV